MPGALLSSASSGHPQFEKMESSRSDLYLIVSPDVPQRRFFSILLTFCLKSSEDTVYEQDILRDPGSVKPWLSYIEFKMHHGTAYEQAFVSW